MPKYIELLPCDWLISNLCYQAAEQVHLIKWPVSVYIISVNFYLTFFGGLVLASYNNPDDEMPGHFDST